MNPVARWIVAVVVVGHGLIHLLGAAKGLGWATVTQLKEPINWPMGLAWLMAAALVVVTGVLLAGAARWWWALGAVVEFADLFGVARSTVYRAVERERTRNVMGVGTTVG